MKKWFNVNNLPIRYKLVTHFLLLSIIPTIVLVVLINWTVERVVEKQVNNQTLQLISKVNESLDYYIGNMQNITYLTGFNNDVKKFLDGKKDLQAKSSNYYEIRKFLQNFTTLYPEIAGILVVNNQGDYVSNELYARTTNNLTNEGWYKEAVKNKGIFRIVGHPESRNVASLVNYKKDEVVSVVRAIIDPITQKVKGVILIDLKLRVIAETVRDVRLGKTGYLTIVNDQGENIYTPDNPLIKTIPQTWLGEKASGMFSKRIDNKKVQLIYQKSSFTNWTTVGLFLTEESIMELKEIRFSLFSFTILFLMFGIMASYYLSHSLSKPITQLMLFMSKAQSGNLKVRYKEKRRDEIGLLGQSFNQLLSKINDLIKLTERHARQKREAEFRSLQANINPHFLYNTLDSIQWMARKKKAFDVAEVVESLAKLFRIGLSKGKDIILLRDEIEHIRSYLMIQKTRYRDKLNYSLYIDPSLENLFVLKLVLQPIVENSIYHGIKERKGPGHITIAAKKVDERLLLYVNDNGIGMSEKKLLDLQHSLKNVVSDSKQSIDFKDKKGYGILNVQARIKLSFGEEYGITVQSKQQEGTQVQIALPILYDNIPTNHKIKGE